MLKKRDLRDQRNWKTGRPKQRKRKKSSALDE